MPRPLAREDPPGFQGLISLWDLGYLPCIIFPFVVLVPLWILCGCEYSGCVIGLVLSVSLVIFPSCSSCSSCSFTNPPPIRERSTHTGVPRIILVSWATLITNLELPPSLSSLILLYFVPIRKFPPKIASPKILWFFRSCEILLILIHEIRV